MVTRTRPPQSSAAGLEPARCKLQVSSSQQVACVGLALAVALRVGGAIGRARVHHLDRMPLEGPGVREGLAGKGGCKNGLFRELNPGPLAP